MAAAAAAAAPEREGYVRLLCVCVDFNVCSVFLWTFNVLCVIGHVPLFGVIPEARQPI